MATTSPVTTGEISDRTTAFYGALPSDLEGGPLVAAREHDDVDYRAYHVLNCRGMSLGGGTDEIQCNTSGERVLGLPPEPGPVATPRSAICRATDASASARVR